MAAHMFRRDLRNIFDAIARAGRPFAEIDIFKPHRIEPLVQTAEPLPHVSTEH
jgi:hypothetical protein